MSTANAKHTSSAVCSRHVGQILIMRKAMAVPKNAVTDEHFALIDDLVSNNSQLWSLSIWGKANLQIKFSGKSDLPSSNIVETSLKLECSGKTLSTLESRTTQQTSL